MAIIYNPPEDNFKKIHYFKKEHFNYYKQGELSNINSARIVLNDFYSDNYLDGSGADGVHFFNITADATLKDSNGYYTFYSCKVGTSGRNLYAELPESVTGTLFIRFSFDVYYYTIEEADE